MKKVASCDLYNLYYAFGGKVQVFVWRDGSKEICCLFGRKVRILNLIPRSARG